MKAMVNFITGIILTVAGIWMLLSNIRVTDIHFWSFYGVNTAPILIILFMVFIVLAIINDSDWMWVAVVLDIVAIIVSVILGTRFTLARMSVLDLCLMLAVLSVGIGLLIRGMIGARRSGGH